MTIKIAINGFGRIGRNILRAITEANREKDVEVVAINDLGGIHTSAHLLRYDSTHGAFRGDVQVEGDYLVINGHKIKYVSQRDPAQLPWRELNVDVVYECSGHFTDKNKAQAHIDAGASKVLISAPGKDADATIVYGVNHHVLKASDKIVSNASCTTNCLAPLAKALHDSLGIVNGLMTTIHAFTNDQNTLDASHSDLRRARTASQSLIPTKTGAASAVGKVLPELNGKLDGFAIRVPTVNVSLVDLTCRVARETSVKEVNTILKQAGQAMKNIVVVNEDLLVSVDFNHNPASSIFDLTETQVIGDLVKVIAWYDNEWGFSNRMIDTSLAMMNF